MRRAGVLFPVLALLAGCLAPPREEDEIARTFRMIEEAERGGPRSGEWPPLNVLVSIERIELAEGSDLDAGALVGYADGNVRVAAGGGRALAGAGVEFAYATEGFWAALGATSSGSRKAVRTKQELAAAPGSTAHLLVASDRLVPVLEVRTREGRTTLWRNARVGVKLDVTPRVAGERLYELELRPAFSREVAAGAVEQTHLATRVYVRDGQGLVLAEDARSATHVSRALFGGSAGQGRARMVLVVTARGM